MIGNRKYKSEGERCTAGLDFDGLQPRNENRFKTIDVVFKFNELLEQRKIDRLER